MFFLGIDGGGTKTAFLLINENGDIIEAKTIATVSYKHVGMDNSIALLKETVHEILNDREAYICLALPNWGESKDGDGEFLSRIKEITELPVKIVNDSVVLNLRNAASEKRAVKKVIGSLGMLAAGIPGFAAAAQILRET